MKSADDGTEKMKATACSAVEQPRDSASEPQQQQQQAVCSIDRSCVQRKGVKNVQSVIPRNRLELLKWNGWGYKDSMFDVKGDILYFTGKRYPIGNQTLPYFTDWAINKLGIDVNRRNRAQPLPKPSDFPKAKVETAFLSELKALRISHSIAGLDRLVRAHGQTLHDAFILREGAFERIPDVVVWPECHEDVVRIVEVAQKYNVVVIPFGGGTSVSGAVSCPIKEQRTILSLDTSQMNRILWIDHGNLVACCESGIIGQDLERALQAQGYTTGHEPDSYEFSSLGGWVATRASGMKKNTYGNIEELLVSVRFVTPTGVLEKKTQVPRMSCGPDFNHIVLGSEGTLGVITEATIKIRPLPPSKKYGSIVFPDFESGVKCLREVARQRLQPSSIRLMDNEQFKFGQTLRPPPGYLGLIIDGLKRMYITKIKGFNVDTMCVATLVFEGQKKDIEHHEKKIYAIAANFNGIPAGEKNGERGYMLTFVIAYIRDLALEFNVVAESFETSVPWDRTITLCKNVKHRIGEECKTLGIDHYFISCRVTQTYDVGSCVYFYFGFNWTSLPETSDPLSVYERLEEMARDEILASGGSLSHHHGVGKLRAKWFCGQVSPLGVQLYSATKKQLDPKNIFACGNLVHIPSSSL
ncbi:alkyldihydroxyacetonephosphate synthase [Frankliniella occidentalis]|uniref:Alkylglycerone-phosphate synthase n=1 Tax=Frankliniella occidentalis TaxID=133901 RepID=A0A6J1SFI9_FRAOC|nr:alkyldihydroxyacetonephosphate synthase [Frankliniella occidentalis]